MSTAFQFVFDKAAQIGLDTRRVVGTTTTRDNTVRTVSRGGQVWRFTVSMPSGLPWSEYRGNIAAIDAADRVTVGNVQINQAGYNSWLTGYQGDITSGTVLASWTQGATSVTLTSGQAVSGYNFRGGDLIKLGTTGRVYQVTADVAYNVNTVPIHRPVIETTGSGQLAIGSNVTWSVICTQLPQWRITDRDIVSWDGDFIFYENMT